MIDEDAMPNKAEEHEVLDCSTLSAHERKEQNKIVKSGSKMPKKSFMWTKAMVSLAEGGCGWASRVLCIIVSEEAFYYI